MEAKYTKGGNTLEDLTKEMEYQKSYSYENRVDIFNKYKISTSTSYINPIMLLSSHIRRCGSEYFNYDSGMFQGVSHSGAVQSAFNKEFKVDKSKYVKVRKGSQLNIYEIFNYSYNKREMEKVMIFRENVETGAVKFKICNPVDFFPKRGFCFYEWAEEFLKDFGFSLNLTDSQ